MTSRPNELPSVSLGQLIEASHSELVYANGYLNGLKTKSQSLDIARYALENAEACLKESVELEALQAQRIKRLEAALKDIASFGTFSDWHPEVYDNFHEKMIEIAREALKERQT